MLVRVGPRAGTRPDTGDSWGTRLPWARERERECVCVREATLSVPTLSCDSGRQLPQMWAPHSHLRYSVLERVSVNEIECTIDHIRNSEVFV